MSARAVILLSWIALTCAPASAQDRPSAPGLKLTLRSLADDKSVDARVSRLLALAVPRGQPASAFLPDGPFTATWEGYINLKIRGDYTFVAQGRGELELSVNGDVVLRAAGDDLSTVTSAKVRLKKGPNPVVARYKPPREGEAAIRLHWFEKQFPPQPLSPLVFSHDANDPALADGMELRQGRELVAKLRCVKCHTSTLSERSMPELSQDAPDLLDIGRRRRTEWMARWISNPKSIRADATMPRIFTSEHEVDPRAADIAAYLASLSPAPAPATPDTADAPGGARLFTQLGCIACHDEATHPLSGMRDRWHADGLKEYLKQPQRHYAWTPMPDFRLSDDEARLLSAYLWHSGDANPPAAQPKGDPQRGRALLATSGCLNCHTMDEKNEFASAELGALRNLERGCLADSDAARGSAAVFDLTDAQRNAIRAIGRSGWKALSGDTPDDFADRQMRLLSCVACHAIDQQPDRLSSLKPQIDQIEKSLPPQEDTLVGDQARPSLTWVGEKLRADWVAEFLVGKVDPRPRPWLGSRMPAFPARARGIAQGLALQHGFISTNEPEPAIDESLAAIGKDLVGKPKGFACVTCHAVGPADAISPFEAWGPNLALTTARFRKEFYHRWVGDPQRYEPGTRMPQYSDSQGKTALRDAFGGDAQRQFEAIWQYLRAGDQIKPPE